MKIIKYIILVILLMAIGWIVSLPYDVPSANLTEPKLANFDFRSEATKLWENGEQESALTLLQSALSFNTDDQAALSDQYNSYLKEVQERKSATGKLKAFGYSFLTGKVNSFEELAGSSVADFFLYGDVRDLSRELVFENDTDTFIVTLSAAGVLTSIFPPADATVSILKSAKKSNALSSPLQQQLVKLIKPATQQTKKLSAIDLKTAVDTLQPIYKMALSCKTWKQFTLYLKHCQSLKQVKFFNKVLTKPENAQKLSSILIILNKFPASAKSSLAYIRNFGQKGMDVLYSATKKGPKGIQFLLKNPSRAFKLSKNAVKTNNLLYGKFHDKWSELKNQHGILMEVVRFTGIILLVTLLVKLFLPKRTQNSDQKSPAFSWNLILSISGIILLIILFKQSTPQIISSESTTSSPSPAGQLNLSSITLLVIFAATQVWAFIKAKSELKEIGSEIKNTLKKQMLENAEFYFDLPIYLGLSGTVFSFILLTFDPSGSRLIAYGTTVTGILLSLYMRGFLLMPLKKELVKGNE